jgi:hypothetical protein
MEQGWGWEKVGTSVGALAKLKDELNLFFILGHFNGFEGDSSNTLLSLMNL